MVTLWFFVVQRASPAVIRLDISLSRPPLTPLRPPCCTDRCIFQLVYTCAHSHKTLGGPEQIDGDNELGQCELVGLSRLLQEKVNPEMKILSFTHPHFILNLYDLLYFTETFFFQSLVFRTPLTFIVWPKKHTETFFKIVLLCSTEDRKSFRFGMTWKWENDKMFLLNRRCTSSHRAAKWCG